MEAKNAKAATKVNCMVVVEMALDQRMMELDEERRRVGRRQRLQMNVMLE